jgi:hypothetical protein
MGGRRWSSGRAARRFGHVAPARPRDRVPVLALALAPGLVARAAAGLVTGLGRFIVVRAVLGLSEAP